MQADRGFTLIEVLIAIAILCILLTVGAPALSNYITNSRIKSVTSELRDGLQTARMEAIKRNTKIDIEIGGSSWAIKNSAGTILRSRTAKTAELALAYTFTANNAATTLSSTTLKTLTFQSDGRMASTSAQSSSTSVDTTADIDIKKTACKTTDGEGEFACLRVMVSPGGMVRACNPASTGKADSCEES